MSEGLTSDTLDTPSLSVASETMDLLLSYVRTSNPSKLLTASRLLEVRQYKWGPLYKKGEMGYQTRNNWIMNGTMINLRDFLAIYY
jgi:hypothetical protein